MIYHSKTDPYSSVSVYIRTNPVSLLQYPSVVVSSQVLVSHPSHPETLVDETLFVFGPRSRDNHVTKRVETTKDVHQKERVVEGGGVSKILKVEPQWWCFFLIRK